MMPFPKKAIMLRHVSLLSIAALLTACGGGGGASNASTAPIIDTRPAAQPTLSLGDFYSYKGTSTSDVTGTPIGTPYSYTNVVTAVETSGAWTEISVDDGPSTPYTQEHFLADSGGDGDRSVQNGCTHNFQSTYSAKQRELVVGASWTRNIVGTVEGDCGKSPMTSGSVNTTVLALESVTVAAGTFKTAKVSIRASYKYASGGAIADESTSWLDTISGRRIKTSTSRIHTTQSGRVDTSSFVTELQGYAQAGTGRSLLNVQRFAGDWTGSFAGPDNGSCTGQVSLDGVLDASCAGGQFTIHGLIDAYGNVTFSLSAGGSTGPSFSGRFDSPLSIHGTWSKPGGGTGTWQLSHL